jgi:heptose I phosphotransferase
MTTTLEPSAVEATATATETGAAGMVPLADGQMWVAPIFLACLTKAGLNTFEQMMASQSGCLLRTLPDRENWRLEIGQGDARQVMYLKRHRERSWLAWLRNRLGLVGLPSAGSIEAHNIARLARHGLASMPLVAYGQRACRGGVTESLVLTAELTGFTQLDHFLRRRFSASAEALGRDPSLVRLTDAVADVAHRFHAANLNHRDFYCCHFFIREPSPERFDVNLIDLQRVQRRRRFQRRWIVKDLAQLAYSAPRERISATRRLAFMRRYLGVRRLRPADKRLIRRVVAKWRAMERRLGAHP